MHIYIMVQQLILWPMGLILTFYMMFQLKPEHHIYEVHGADGTVYHTTNLHYGRNDIWFTNENGNAVVLGGGYTVIRKQ